MRVMEWHHPVWSPVWGVLMMGAAACYLFFCVRYIVAFIRRERRIRRERHAAAGTPIRTERDAPQIETGGEPLAYSLAFCSLMDAISIPHGLRRGRGRMASPARMARYLLSVDGTGGGGVPKAWTRTRCPTRWKNPGYALGHNFGHGEKHLATVPAHLMMPALPHRPDPSALLRGVPPCVARAKYPREQPMHRYGTWGIAGTRVPRPGQGADEFEVLFQRGGAVAWDDARAWADARALDLRPIIARGRVGSESRVSRILKRARPLRGNNASAAA